MTSKSQPSNLLKMNKQAMPGLYRSSSSASKKGQTNYFLGLKVYLALLILAAILSFILSEGQIGASLALVMFCITLGILIWMKIQRPDDTWYNARAVAESIKTISWRWVMKADPYNTQSTQEAEKLFIKDLKKILNEHQRLLENSSPTEGIKQPISETMLNIRELSVQERLEIYKKQRIKDQASWYARKSEFNKKWANFWFIASVVLHIIVIAMLTVRITDPTLSFPIEVFSAMIGAASSWLEAKKYKELTSSYSLAAHEIGLIQAEANSVATEADLSKFVFDSEHAFSSEHTQWAARKSR